MTSLYSLDQRFSLVLDCYKSGLPIPLWCRKRGIAPGTFYGLIKQVSNKGYDVPDFTRHRTACKKEIVRISVVDSLDAVPCADVFPAIDGKEVLSATLVISAHIGGATVDNLNLQLANKDAELNYLKSKLFGSSSEKFKTPIPGQLSLFEELNDDRTLELIEAEDIQVEAHKRTRKKKATYDEMFAIDTEVVRTEVIFHKATLERIKYERTYREKGLLYKHIYNRRQKDQKPVVEAFLSWINKQNPSKGSRLDRVITYAKNQAPYMMTYLEDSRCELSNNLSENSIRPVTVRRRNWLFCDTTDGANASMTDYS